MKENLFMCFRGNGIGVSDRNREENGDYKHIAHIGEDGTIKYYCRVSLEAKQTIEKEASRAVPNWVRTLFINEKEKYKDVDMYEYYQKYKDI